MKQIVIFASGSGSTFQYLVQQGHGKDYQVTMLFCNRAQAGVIERAKALNIPYMLTEAGWINTLHSLKPDLVVLAGYLKLLEPEITANYTVINTHPALLPKYGGRGYYGERVHQAVLANNEHESGCTVHYVNEQYDEGTVIAQAHVPVCADDDVERLSARVQAAEKPLLYQVIKQILGGSMRALLSVYDKTGIVELASFLLEQGYELISSGGTFAHLHKHGLAVQEVSEMTGFPEILDGRVKTLHPAVHGGLLANRNLPEHMEAIKQLNIAPIDLVCVNLYPFYEKLQEHLSFEQTIEFIDIGGPSMLRSAAKNHEHVLVLSDPEQYSECMERLKNGQADPAYRRKLAARVFAATSAYDAAIQGFLNPTESAEFLSLSYQKKLELRYGENPHQKATFYRSLVHKGFLSDFDQLGGKELSYINIKDIDAAYGVVSEFEQPCACAVKHNTPCGVAIGDSAFSAYKRCFACDPVSIFGGIVALNREIDAQTAQEMVKIFLEVVIAPAFSQEALEILRNKKNLRIIKINAAPSKEMLVSSVNGGILIQEPDDQFVEGLHVVTKRQPDEQELDEMRFAYRVVKHVKSNAIVVSRSGQAVGIGGGQTNRIDPAKYALEKGKGGSVLASDAFFPVDDTIVRLAAEAGIQCIIQPGGSIKDQDMIDACDELGLCMVFTGMRHFKH